MPNVNDLYPSKWLKAEDLKHCQVPVVIDHVEVENMGDETKPVVYFRGKEKGLVCNKTNALAIADIAGSGNTEDWGGTNLVLFSTKVTFQGRMTDAIRVMPAPEREERETSRPAPVKQRAPITQEQEAESIEDEDSIPF